MKPVLPLEIFKPVTKAEIPHLTGTFELTGGLAFGMVVRTGVTKSISFETGISQITRRYDVRMTNDTSGFDEANTLRYVGYEVPLLAMVYIRLGERTWMNNALGVSLDMFPSDAQRLLEQGRVDLFRGSWVHTGVVGNVGVEYRTDHSGIFYLGATYHGPFGPVAVSQFIWTDEQNKQYTARADLAGTYLTVDLRYFFHEDPERRSRRTKKNEQ